MDVPIALVHGQGFGEIVEVAVEVHVFMRVTAQVREPVGIERVNMDKCYAIGTRVGPQGVVVKRSHLNAAASEAFHAVATTADQEKVIRRRVAVDDDVHRQRLGLESW
jgi:hypothetical protein